MTLVRSLLDGNEQEFTRIFQDFLDNTPSFLHSGIQHPFFPAFFAGAFVTAFDCGIANGERIFFRSDINPNNNQQRSLKIAVLSNPGNNQQRFVRCYTILGGIERNINLAVNNATPRLRFTQEDADAMLANLIEIGENEDIQVDELVWEEHKILLERHEQNVYVRWIDFNGAGMFNQALGHNVNFTEIQQNIVADERLANFPNLANNNAVDVQDSIQELLEYITEIYNQYNQALNFDLNRKSNYHGFLSGFLTNFRLAHTAGIYPELFMGEGYADTVLLVRGQNNITNSVPVIIELGIGGGANVALEKAHTRVNRCPISSLSLNTTSQDAVCVGLDFNANPSSITDVEHFLQEEQPLMEVLCETILELPDFQQNVAQNVSNYLRFPSFGKPVSQSQFLNADNRRFNYVTSFTCGNAAFAANAVPVVNNENEDEIHINKYLFQYNDAMSLPVDQNGQQPLGVGEDVNNYTSTIVLHTQFGSIGRAIIFRIHNVLDYAILPLLGLQLDNLGLQPQDELYEITCNMNPNMVADNLPRVGGNQVDPQVVAVNALTYGEYLQMHNNQFHQGNLLQVNDIGNLHNIAGRMMNNNWTNIVAHGELMQGISRVLFPLGWIVNRNNARGDGFHAVLHGAFHACIYPNKVIVEFQVGGGSRIDLLLARNPALIAQGLNNGIDTQPIGIEVKFFIDGEGENAGHTTAEARRQIERYGSCNGYARTSDGKQVALSYAVFNNEEQQNPDTLILCPKAISVYPINRGFQI